MASSRPLEAEMAAGRHAIAARNLNELIARTPDTDEAFYRLGVCERARGRNQAAAEQSINEAGQDPPNDRTALPILLLPTFAMEGRDDEASRLLDACQKRRPDDIPVWRARLNWGMAAGEVARKDQQVPRRDSQRDNAQQAERSRHPGPGLVRSIDRTETAPRRELRSAHTG
jgi:predicted Zn-dependent protease